MLQSFLRPSQKSSSSSLGALRPRALCPGLAAAALASALVAGAAPVRADSTDATVVSATPKQIPVLSNGSSYTSVPWNGNVLVDIHVKLDGDISGRVKEYKTWFGLKPESWAPIQFPQYGGGETFPFGRRPKTVNKVVHLQVPAVAYQGFAVFHCNELADKLRQQGLSDQQIFAEDRSVELKVYPYIEAEYSGIEGYNLTQAVVDHYTIDLKCQKWQGASFPTAGQFAPGFQVTGAKLFVAPAYKNLTADCPVTVPLVAEFTATNAGTLKFRFVSASGKVSQLYTANITGKTGGVFKALYEKQIQVPLTQASGMGGGAGGGGGGIVDQQGGGGFAVQTQPEEPIVPTAPSSGGMGQVQVNPLAGNIHSESFRVEVVQPATGIASGYAGYRITCKPKTTPGIGGPQGVSVRQQVPQPGGATAVIGGIRSGQQPPMPTAKPVAPTRIAPTRIAPPAQVAPPQPMQMQLAPQQ